MSFHSHFLSLSIQFFFLFINVKLCKYNVYIDHNDWGILVQLLLLVWEKNNIILEETLPSCVTPPPPRHRDIMTPLSTTTIRLLPQHSLSQTGS